MSEQQRSGDPAEAPSRPSPSASPSPSPSPRPRPTPGGRPAPGARPTPRPRVAGSRRERADDEQPRTTPPAVARRTADQPAEGLPPEDLPAEELPAAAPRAVAQPRSGATARRADRAAPSGQRAGRRRRSGRLLVLLLAVLCALAAATGGWLVRQRLHPATVDPSLFSAARADVEALYAYDYGDSEGSVQRKLDVLTGDLQEQYRQDLSSGGIIDTYEQVSATTRYDVAEVGLQQVDRSQDRATVVVFGRYVVTSVNSGTQQAPSGSECTVTEDGAQACTQTVQVTMTRVGGDWRISELTLLTTS